MADDPLQLLPVEKWCELEEVFKSDFPRSISAFTLLEAQKHILKSGLYYGFKVYCPFGDVRNGMVALNLKKTLYEVIVQCANDDTSKLEAALLNTKIVDWSRKLEVPFAPPHVAKCIRRIIQDKGLKICHITITTVFILDNISSLFNITLPPGYSFDLLSLEYVDYIDSFWPHKYPGSDFYFELLIKAKMGYGLFRDKKLISWVLIKEMGALLHLYTLQEERRKGYGELVLKLISNFLLKEGKHVVAFCVSGNDNAAKLYKKLNFQSTIDVEWCTTDGKK